MKTSTRFLHFNAPGEKAGAGRGSEDGPRVTVMLALKQEANLETRKPMPTDSSGSYIQCKHHGENELVGRRMVAGVGSGRKNIRRTEY